MGININERLYQYIMQNASISIAEFMSIASTSPNSGYYTNKEEFTSDFITAPEISPLFNLTIASKILEDLELLKTSNSIKLIELGPGSGSTMEIVLNALSKIKHFYEKSSVHLVEISNKLKSVQKRKLSKHIDKITWHKSIHEINIDCPFILFCNEFFDTLPSNQFILIQDELLERRIKLDQKTQTIKFIAQKSILSMQINPKRLLKCPHEGIIENSPASKAIMQDICYSISKYGGTATIIDHGYTDDTYKCTLKAIKNHKILNIERDDLSASDVSIDVNFASLMECAQQVGNFSKIETQKKFLESSSVFIANKNKRPESEIKFLINKMGTKFKVMHISSMSQ